MAAESGAKKRSGSGGPQRFRPTDRLLDRRDFDRVLKRGRRRSSPELVVVVCRRPADGRRPRRSGGISPEGEDGARVGVDAVDGVAARSTELSAGSRLGITVGRKVGPAVERNRFKRRVREWFRRHRDDFEEGLDIVVIARRPAVELSSAALGERLSQLLSRRPVRSA